MDVIVWWSTSTLVITAAIFDIHCRRIPNWLSGPFLVAGLVHAAVWHGLARAGQSLEAVALAAFAFGIVWWLRGVGMGDVKLLAAVGAWVGLAQMEIALVLTALAGGAIALLWAARKREVQGTMDGAAELLAGFAKRGLRPHPLLTLENSRNLVLPYAPAIAIGTMLSFFCFR